MAYTGVYTIVAEVVIRNEKIKIRVKIVCQNFRCIFRLRVHLEIPLDFADEMCYTEGSNAIKEQTDHDKNHLCAPRKNLSQPNDRVYERPDQKGGFHRGRRY